jgi:hypothetical protein
MDLHVILLLFVLEALDSCVTLLDCAPEHFAKCHSPLTEEMACIQLGLAASVTVLYPRIAATVVLL